MKGIAIIATLCLLLSSIDGFAQKATLNGYVSGVYTGLGGFERETYQNGGLLHNRLNFLYMPYDKWEAVVDLRTRAIVGDAYQLSKTTNDEFTRDNGLMDLSWNIANSNSFLLNTSVERVYVGYQSAKFSARLGRQRINWSQTMVFNPNDIFNTYSFFDFDYPERAGSDALRLSYYPSGISTLEFVFKMDREDQITAVGFYRGNVDGWDLQGLGGLYNDDDILLGGGFSGTVKGVNLRGELSYYYDTNPKEDEMRNTFLASLGADYIFPSSLVLSAEVLYNSMPENQTDIDNSQLISAPMSAKKLSVTEFTTTAQMTYQFSAIIDGGISAIYYVNMPALYLGPSLNVSATDNLMISAVAQLFVDSNDSDVSSMYVAYLRLKYNF